MHIFSYICIYNCIHFGSMNSLQDCMLSWPSKNWPFGAFGFAGCLKNGLRQNRLLSFKAVLSDHDIRVFRRRCLFLVPLLFIFRFLVVVS